MPDPGSSIEMYKINMKDKAESTTERTQEDCAAIVREYVQAAQDREEHVLAELLEEIADDVESR